MNQLIVVLNDGMDAIAEKAGESHYTGIIMKKIVLLVTLFATGIPLGAIELARNGEAAAQIVVSENASFGEKHAAQELAHFLHEITGGTFEPVAAPVSGQANLCVGRGAARAVHPRFTTDGLGADGMVIQTHDGNVILAGGEPRGTLYAVYSFLEDEIGCRWWSHTVSTIPSKPTLAVGPLDRRHVPPYEHREIHIVPISHDPDWCVRNKCVGEMTGYGRFNMMPERGGCRKAWPCGHSYYTILPPDKYFEDHPEWYSLHGNKRVSSPKIHSSLCLTNEKMQREFTRRVLEEVRGGPAMFQAGGPQYVRYIDLVENPLMHVSVSPEDDSGYPFQCQCEPCAAVDQAEGSASGNCLRLANRVARELRAEFPEKSVYMYAYHQTQKPPLVTRPEPGLIIWYGPINASFSKPLTHPRNKRWHDDLADWLKISDRVYLYDYPDNVTYKLTPHPNLYVLAENIRWCADQGVTGYYGDGIIGGTGGTEMAELRAWMVAKLLWDPSREPESLIREFTDGYYGPAGAPIRAYLDVIHDAVDRSGDWLTLSSPPDAQFLSLETMLDAWKHLTEAEAAVREGMPEILHRVRIAQLPALFVFQARWDNLNYLAGTRGLEWPFTASKEEARAEFDAMLQTGNVTLDHSSNKILNEP